MKLINENANKNTGMLQRNAKFQIKKNTTVLRRFC